MPSTPTNPPLPPELRGRLNAAHAALLAVHKALLDHARAGYERSRGPVGSPLNFLKLAMSDPAFAWLRPLSELIVQIDEATAVRTPPVASAAEALLTSARALLTPSDAAPAGDFRHHYGAALRESQEVTTAHADWKRVAGPEGTANG